MNETAALQLLVEAGENALETMFFAVPDASSVDRQRPPGELIAASLTFAGEPPGRFDLLLSEPVARSIASNFLGTEDEQELTPDQIGDVVSEFTNIICGSVLSELERKANFDLSSPVAVRVAPADPLPAYWGESPIICRFELPGGSLLLGLALEEAT